MTAFNVVRYLVKPGREEDFIAAHRSAHPGFRWCQAFRLDQDRRTKVLRDRRVGKR